MIEFLGIVELGTLIYKNQELPLPTRPWWSGGYPLSLDKHGDGNIPRLAKNVSISNYKIGDTSSKKENRLKWIKIKTEKNEVLYICDRNILTDFKLFDLNYNYRDNPIITIDGKRYICRLIDGGDGTSTTENEWDKYIGNTSKIKGLPIPSQNDLDKNLEYCDLEGEHNKMWNWWGCGTVCINEFKAKNWNYTTKGYYSPLCAYGSEREIKSTHEGWRPVLQALECNYRITLDREVDKVGINEGQLIRFNPKINGKELNIKQIDKDKIIYTTDNLNTDTVDLEIEGNSCTLDKLNYVIY